jgi:hypothetical protein
MYEYATLTWHHFPCSLMKPVNFCVLCLMGRFSLFCSTNYVALFTVTVLSIDKCQELLLAQSSRTVYTVFKLVTGKINIQQEHFNHFTNSTRFCTVF